MRMLQRSVVRPFLDSTRSSELRSFIGGCHQNSGSHICHVSRWLLQLLALRCFAVPTKPFTACSQRLSACHLPSPTVLPYHPNAVPTSLASSFLTHQIQDGVDGFQSPPWLCSVSELLHMKPPGRCALRSDDQHLFLVPWTKLKTFGDRAFAVAGPRVWNSVRLSICRCEHFQS